MHPLDEVIPVARRQHGLLTRAQLKTAGAGRALLRDAVIDGRLTRMGRAVYHLASQEFTYRSAALAPCLMAEDAVVSHRSAGVLHELIKPILKDTSVGPPIAVTRPLRRSARATAAATVHRLPLPDHHVTRVDGVPVTTVSRTLVDLAAVTKPVALQRLIEESLRKGKCSLAGLDLVRRELAGPRAGAATIGPVLARVAAAEVPTRAGDLSALAHGLLASAGLRPAWEVAITWERGFIGVVDCLFADEKVVVEFDDRRWHDDKADAARDRDLVAAGYLVIRVTTFDLTKRPEAFLAELRAVLAGRRANAAANPQVA